MDIVKQFKNDRIFSYKRKRAKLMSMIAIEEAKRVFASDKEEVDAKIEDMKTEVGALDTAIAFYENIFK